MEDVYFPISDEELDHSGIKGMRWGVRRYQNKDGTLTPAGKKRYNRDYASDAKTMSDQELRAKINRMNLEKRYTNLSKSSGSKLNSALDATGKVTGIGTNASKMVRDTSKLAGVENARAATVGQGFSTLSKTASTAKKINNVVSDRKVGKQAKTKLENMTDKDLQDMVNRMDLEQQYANLSRETVSRGRTRAMDVLDIASDVIAIGASATAIAVGIHKLMNS